MSKTDEILKIIQEEERDGQLILMTDEGLAEINIEEFFTQPAEGILYDLNRLKECSIAMARADEEDPRWINDYAVAIVITKLKEYYDKYQELVGTK